MEEILPGAFVGRDRELADMRAGLKDAFRGQGKVFLIAGEPGIGKTALAECLARHAEEEGARVVWSRSWDGGGAAPYWTWAQVIRGLSEDLDDEALGSFVSSETAHVTLLAPQLADRFGDAAKSIREPDSDAGRFYLFEATARFLKHVSSTVPLVLVLDDVLDGDRPSLLLLRFLARDVRTSRMVVIATYRDTEATRSAEIVDVLADLVREGHVINLQALGRDQVERLIAEVSGVTPWEGKVAAIHEATGGNPLFVREVTRLLTTVDPLDRPGKITVPVPDSVRAVIQRRLAPLSADAIQALSAAAVVGREFGLTLVSAACDLPADRVLASLADAVALGIVAEAADRPGTYRFSHPLMREAVYEGLPIAARTQMHQRVGAAIERLHGPGSPSHLGQLAYHFARAAAMGASDKAGEYAGRAGDAAMASFAYEEAVLQYRRALDALALAEAPDAPLRAKLLVRLGRAHARAGEYRESKATCLLAAEIARELGDLEQLAEAALVFAEPQVEGGLVDRQLVALLDEANEGLSPEDSPLRARVLARLSLELTFSDDESLRESRRQSLSLEAIRMARRFDDVVALCSALRARWLALWGPDGLEERSALADEHLRLARATGDREIELLARARRITCLIEAGKGAEAAVDVAAHARLADELRMPHYAWGAATMRAGRALLEGSFREAEPLAEAALARLPERPNATHAHLNQLTMLRWEQGRLGELRDTWQGLLDRFPQLEFGRGWLCLAEAERGREGAARGALRALVDAIPELPRDGLYMPALALAALGCARLEESDAAAVLYPLLLPYADRAIVIPMPHPAMCFGSASLYLGLLAAEMSAWDEAEGHFEAAIRVNGRLGSRPFLARARCELAGALLRRGRAGDRERALVLLEGAAAMGEAVGMRQLAERVENLRARVSGTGTPPALAADAAARSNAARVAGRHVFRHEGEYWTVVHEGTVVRLRDTKGMRCLARLLAHPGREILAVDLEAWDGRADESGGGEAERGTGPSDLAVRPDLGDAGVMLDAQAKEAYRNRLEELRAELDEAEGFNDPVRAAAVQEEIDLLTSELARAVGLGGRDRRAGAHAERARLNVTRAIKTALRRLAEDHPALGDHLALTVHTGRYCVYTPDPRAPISWET